MNDRTDRETKPDMRKGMQATVQSGKGKETAIDRHPVERAVERPAIERKA